MLIKDQFGIIQNLQTSPIPETSLLVGTFCHFLQHNSSSNADFLSILIHLENCIPSILASFSIKTPFLDSFMFRFEEFIVAL